MFEGRLQDEKNTSFVELLEKGSSVSIHHSNLYQTL